jgi:NAD(P)-dependent dehydrogenase (short-subunit alcohol dehydrogenase family)
MGLVAFTKALAAEGVKYNIKSICIAPVSAYGPFPSTYTDEYFRWLRLP